MYYSNKMNFLSIYLYCYYCSYIIIYSFLDNYDIWEFNWSTFLFHSSSFFCIIYCSLFYSSFLFNKNYVCLSLSPSFFKLSSYLSMIACCFCIFVFNYSISLQCRSYCSCFYLCNCSYCYICCICYFSLKSTNSYSPFTFLIYEFSLHMRLFNKLFLYFSAFNSF